MKNIIEVIRSGWLPPALDLPFWAGSISSLGTKQSSTWSAKYLIDNGLVYDAILSNVKT